MERGALSGEAGIRERGPDSWQKPEGRGGRFLTDWEYGALDEGVGLLRNFPLRKRSGRGAMEDDGELVRDERKREEDRSGEAGGRLLKSIFKKNRKSCQEWRNRSREAKDRLLKSSFKKNRGS